MYILLVNGELVNVLRAAFLFLQFILGPILGLIGSNWQLKITGLAPPCLESNKMKKGVNAKKSKRALPVSTSKQRDLSAWKIPKPTENQQKTPTEDDRTLTQNPLKEALNYLEKSKNRSKCFML